MLISLSIFVPGCGSEVYYEKFSLFLSWTKHNIRWLELVMNEVFEVKILQDCNDLLPKHEDGFRGEGTPTVLLDCIQRSI